MKNFEEQMKENKVGFESSTQRFELRNMEMWKTHERFKSSQDGFKSHLQNEVEDRAEGFKSSSYGFESLFGAQFTFCKRDSNSRVTNSNPPSADALNA